jgi:tight adherence protein C
VDCWDGFRLATHTPEMAMRVVLAMCASGVAYALGLVWQANPLRFGHRTRHPTYSLVQSIGEGRLRIRKAVAAQEMPYALELMALCVTSGMSLMQAIEMVGTHGRGEFYEAILSAHRDYAAGMSRIEVLQRLKQRLPCTTMHSLVSAIKQAEVTGTPIAEILQVHSEAARHEEHTRRLRAMELVPLQLVIVTVLLLLPSVLIVSMVPHVIAFTKGGW